MASELRLIQLDRSELCAAVQSYLRVNLDIIGAVTVTAVSVADDGALVVAFRRATGTVAAEPELILDQNQACAVLVRFCLENNIPLPRRGAKSSVRSGTTLALRIQCSAPAKSAAASDPTPAGDGVLYDSQTAITDS